MGFFDELERRRQEELARRRKQATSPGVKEIERVQERARELSDIENAKDDRTFFGGGGGGGSDEESFVGGDGGASARAEQQRLAEQARLAEQRRQQILKEQREAIKQARLQREQQLREAKTFEEREQARTDFLTTTEISRLSGSEKRIQAGISRAAPTPQQFKKQEGVVVTKTGAGRERFESEQEARGIIGGLKEVEKQQAELKGKELRGLPSVVGGGVSKTFEFFKEHKPPQESKFAISTVQKLRDVNVPTFFGTGSIKVKTPIGMIFDIEEARQREAPDTSAPIYFAQKLFKGSSEALVDVGKRTKVKIEQSPIFRSLEPVSEKTFEFMQTRRSPQEVTREFFQTSRSPQEIISSKLDAGSLKLVGGVGGIAGTIVTSGAVAIEQARLKQAPQQTSRQFFFEKLVESTPPTATIKKSFKQSDEPVFRDFFTQKLGEGFQQAGTDIAEVSLFKDSQLFAKQRDKTFEFQPASKVIGAGVGKVGEFGLFAVPGVGEILFAEPLITRGIVGGGELEKFAKKHPIETGLIVGGGVLTTLSLSTRVSKIPQTKMEVSPEALKLSKKMIREQERGSQKLIQERLARLEGLDKLSQQYSDNLAKIGLKVEKPESALKDVIKTSFESISEGEKVIGKRQVSIIAGDLTAQGIFKTKVEAVKAIKDFGIGKETLKIQRATELDLIKGQLGDIKQTVKVPQLKSFPEIGKVKQETFSISSFGKKGKETKGFIYQFGLGSKEQPIGKTLTLFTGKGKLGRFDIFEKGRKSTRVIQTGTEAGSLIVDIKPFSRQIGTQFVKVDKTGIQKIGDVTIRKFESKFFEPLRFKSQRDSLAEFQKKFVALPPTKLDLKGTFPKGKQFVTELIVPVKEEPLSITTRVLSKEGGQVKGVGEKILGDKETFIQIARGTSKKPKPLFTFEKIETPKGIPPVSKSGQVLDVSSIQTLKQQQKQLPPSILTPKSKIKIRTPTMKIVPSVKQIPRIEEATPFMVGGKGIQVSSDVSPVGRAITVEDSFTDITQIPQVKISLQPSQVQVVKSDLDIKEKQDILSVVKIKTVTGLKDTLDIREEQRIVQREIQKPKLDLKQELKIKQEETSIPKSTSNLIFRRKVTTEKKPKPPEEIKLIIPPFKFKTPKQPKGKGIFTVEYRRGGVFKPLATTKTLRQAFAVGTEKVGGTLAATFKIKGVGVKGRLKTPKGFVQKRGGVFIEQPKLRLSRTGEITEIQVAKKRKKKSKKQKGGKK